MSFYDHRSDNAESQATATAKCPEEICVGGAGSSHESSVCSNRYVCEHLVCCHIVDRGHWGVTATGKIATCPTHCLANACKDSHIFTTSGFKDLEALNSSTGLESRAAVVIIVELLDSLTP